LALGAGSATPFHHLACDREADGLDNDALRVV
jgi:hypothetical protein